MLTIESLRSFGANVDEGLQRCMNNEAFYLQLVGMAIDDQGFEKLSDAVAKHDLDAAFEAAHALKGVLGNLSLTPIYESASEITELLRARTEADYSSILEKILSQRDWLRAM